MRRGKNLHDFQDYNSLYPASPKFKVGTKQMFPALLLREGPLSPGHESSVTVTLGENWMPALRDAQPRRQKETETLEASKGGHGEL